MTPVFHWFIEKNRSIGVLVFFSSSCALEKALHLSRVIKIPMCKCKISVTGCGHISYSWPGESRILPGGEQGQVGQWGTPCGSSNVSGNSHLKRCVGAPHWPIMTRYQGKVLVSTFTTPYHPWSPSRWLRVTTYQGELLISTFIWSFVYLFMRCYEHLPSFELDLLSFELTLRIRASHWSD